MMEMQKTRTSGFASMDTQKQREIARKGGMAAHRKGTAHEFTTDEARDAGRKGGQQVSANRTHMVAIGRAGGIKSAERRRLNKLNSANVPVMVEAESNMEEAPAQHQAT